MANVPSLILITPMMEALCSSEMSVLTRVKRRNIPGDGILHSIPIDYIFVLSHLCILTFSTI
jgi:hypothetical protein